ncbi:DUF2955 domain-containing protein [Photobacterium profundum]|uniref:DUF2955 domain-containing protein n=1 Tax=Photobacterium profundum TaxID=74109 RepID=UPI003D12A5E7
MSDNSHELVADIHTPPTEQAIVQRRIFRYVIGLVAACALAFGIGWGLSFVAPVFLAKFLVDHQKPTSHTISQLLLAMTVTVLIGLSVSAGITQYPLPLLLLLSLLMFTAYYLFMDPQWNFFATILMIAVMLLPFMGIISPGLAVYIGVGLATSGVVAVLLFGLLHLLLPDIAPINKEQLQPAPSLTHDHRVFESLKALTISFPIIAYFYYFQITGAILTMAFIGLLSLQTAGQKSIKVSMFLLLTNIIGGLVAIVYYELLVMVPHFLFMLSLIALIGLVLGTKIFNEPAKAPIWAGVMSALLVLLGSTVASDSKLMDDNFYMRIAQIMMASIYMIVVSFILDKWQYKQDVTKGSE